MLGMRRGSLLTGRVPGKSQPKAASAASLSFGIDCKPPEVYNLWFRNAINHTLTTSAGCENILRVRGDLIMNNYYYFTTGQILYHSVTTLVYALRSGSADGRVPGKSPTTIICVYSFTLYVPKQQPCKMWGVFLQQ